MSKKLNNFMNLIRKEKDSGFGLTEAVVSIGVLAILVTGLISQQRLSSKGITTVASETEINNVTKRVFSEVGLLSVCSLSENFGGQYVERSSITSLQNTAGALTTSNTIIKVGDVFGSGNGQIEVTGIKSAFRESSSLSPNEMYLTLSFRKKEGNIISGVLSKFTTRSVEREIPLNILTDGASPARVTNCYGNYDLIVKTAVELSCVGNGAKYDPTVNLPYGECQHVNTAITCPAGQYIKRVVAPPGASANAKGTATVSYVCASLENACPNNYFVTGFNSDGSVQCALVYKECGPNKILFKTSSGAYVCTDINCPSLQAFNGTFNAATGAANCVNIPVSGCGTGYATSYNTDGSVTCNTATVNSSGCGVGQRVTGIGLDGNVTCADWFQLPASCPPGYAIDGVDASGYRTCKYIQRPLACDGTRASHNYQDCTNAGGTIEYKGTGNSMCRFNLATCPAGWSRCYSFGHQTTNACFDASNTGYCDGNRTWRYAVPPGGDGNWQNNGQGSTGCILWSGYPNTSHACYASTYATIYSNQTSVGCY